MKRKNIVLLLKNMINHLKIEKIKSLQTKKIFDSKNISLQEIKDIFYNIDFFNKNKKEETPLFLLLEEAKKNPELKDYIEKHFIYIFHSIDINKPIFCDETLLTYLAKNNRYFSYRSIYHDLLNNTEIHFPEIQAMIPEKLWKYLHTIEQRELFTKIDYNEINEAGYNILMYLLKTEIKMENLLAKKDIFNILEKTNLQYQNKKHESVLSLLINKKNQWLMHEDILEYIIKKSHLNYELFHELLKNEIKINEKSFEYWIQNIELNSSYTIEDFFKLIVDKIILEPFHRLNPSVKKHYDFFIENSSFTKMYDKFNDSENLSIILFTNQHNLFLKKEQWNKIIEKSDFNQLTRNGISVLNQIILAKKFSSNQIDYIKMIQKSSLENIEKTLDDVIFKKLYKFQNNLEKENIVLLEYIITNYPVKITEENLQLLQKKQFNLYKIYQSKNLKSQLESDLKIDKITIPKLKI